MPQYKIKDEEITRLRALYRTQIVEEMKRYKSKQNEKFIEFDFVNHALLAEEEQNSKKVPNFEVSQFLSHFTLFKGIQQFYLEEQMENVLARQDSTTGYANRDERLISQLRCCRDWPICIFDFTVTSTLHEFFALKARAPAQSVKDRN